MPRVGRVEFTLADGIISLPLRNSEILRLRSED